MSSFYDLPNVIVTPAHGLVERPGARPQRRAVLRQPAPVRDRRAAAQRGRPERRLLIPATIRRCRSPSSGLPDRARPPSSTRSPAATPRPAATAGSPSTSASSRSPTTRLDTPGRRSSSRRRSSRPTSPTPTCPRRPPSTEGHIGTEELPADHLARLRDSDALLHVVRAFEDPANPHPDGSVDPARDLERLDLEFLLADLAMTERRLERLKTSAPARQPGRARGRRARGGRPPPDPRRPRGGHADPRPGPRRRRREGDPRLPVPDPEARPRAAQRRRGRPGRRRRRWSSGSPPPTPTSTPSSTRCRPRSRWSSASSSPTRRPCSWRSSGSPSPGSTGSSRCPTSCSGSISFLTAGPDEVRAWPIPDGSTAVDAAGGDPHGPGQGASSAPRRSATRTCVTLGSMAEARKAGRLRSEGKTYRVRDGDVLEILFSQVISSGGRERRVELGDDRVERLAFGRGPASGRRVVVVVLVLVGVGQLDLGRAEEVLARRRSRR